MKRIIFAALVGVLVSGVLGARYAEAASAEPRTEPRGEHMAVHARQLAQQQGF